MTHQIDEQQEQALVDAFRPFAALIRTVPANAKDTAELWSAYKVDQITGEEGLEKAFLYVSNLRTAETVLKEYELGQADIEDIVAASRVFVEMVQTFSETQQYDQDLYAAEELDSHTGRWTGRMVRVTVGDGRLLQRHINLFDTGVWVDDQIEEVLPEDPASEIGELAEAVWQILQPRVQSLLEGAPNDDENDRGGLLGGGLL